jgi:hypothetical protein
VLVQVHDLVIVGLSQEAAELAEAEVGLVESGVHLEHLPLHVRIADRVPAIRRHALERAPQQLVRRLQRLLRDRAFARTRLGGLPLTRRCSLPLPRLARLARLAAPA